MAKINRLSKNKSMMIISSNPLEEGLAGSTSDLHVENIANAVLISDAEFQSIIMAKMKATEDNDARLLQLEDLKQPYLFTSKQLCILIDVTTSVKTRIGFITCIAPRLVDPKAKLEYFSGLFRYSGEKMLVEGPLKQRIQAVTSSMFSKANGAMRGGPLAGGRGGGRGAGRGGAGRGRRETAPPDMQSSASAAVNSNRSLPPPPEETSKEPPKPAEEPPKPPEPKKSIIPVDVVKRQLVAITEGEEGDGDDNTPATSPTKTGGHKRLSPKEIESLKASLDGDDVEGVYIVEPDGKRTSVGPHKPNMSFTTYTDTISEVGSILETAGTDKNGKILSYKSSTGSMYPPSNGLGCGSGDTVESNAPVQPYTDSMSEINPVVPDNPAVEKKPSGLRGFLGSFRKAQPIKGKIDFSLDEEDK